MELKINGLIKEPRWKKIKCICKSKIEEKYPFIKCNHCKAEEAQNSMPTKPFKNRKGKTITEITLDIDSKDQSVRGWVF
tara:strand:- start:339 stop:575 length:237 start_codon:yes stop_codon:yes gene_type:complete